MLNASVSSYTEDRYNIKLYIQPSHRKLNSSLSLVVTFSLDPKCIKHMLAILTLELNYVVPIMLNQMLYAWEVHKWDDLAVFNVHGVDE